MVSVWHCVLFCASQFVIRGSEPSAAQALARSGAPASVSPHPRSRHLTAAKVLMRSGGSVLEAPPGAEEGALPREHEHEAAWYTPTPAHPEHEAARHIPHAS